MAGGAGAGTGGTGEYLNIYKGPLADALLGEKDHERGYEGDSEGDPESTPKPAQKYQPLSMSINHRPNSETPRTRAPAKTSCFKLRIKTYCSLFCLSATAVFLYFVATRQLSLISTHTSDCLKLEDEDICKVPDQDYWIAVCGQNITACVKACLQEKPPSLIPFCNPHYKTITGTLAGAAVVSLFFGAFLGIRSIWNYCERKSKSSIVIQLPNPADALVVIAQIQPPTQPHQVTNRPHSAPL